MADTTVKIKTEDLTKLYDIVVKYQDFFIALAKISGLEQVQDFNTAARIINEILEQADSQ